MHVVRCAACGFVVAQQSLAAAENDVDRHARELHRWTDTFNLLTALPDDPQNEWWFGPEALIDSLQQRLSPRPPALAAAAYQLSTYAASIDWSGGRNRGEWLLGLRDRIDTVQQIAIAAGVPTSGMNIDDDGLEELIGRAIAYDIALEVKR